MIIGGVLRLSIRRKELGYRMQDIGVSDWSTVEKWKCSNKNSPTAPLYG